MYGRSTKVYYINRTEISASKLNITAGARCIVNESGKCMNDANCSDLNFFRYEFMFGADCDSYLNLIVGLSKHCMMESTLRNAAVCDSNLPVCTYYSDQSQTDLQHKPQITTTPVLPSTTWSAQSNSTGLPGAASEPAPTVPSGIASPSIAPADTASEPTPSVPSSTNATDCIRLERVSCYILYLAAGLGALAVTVVLLVVVVIVLVCISVKRGKMKMQSERECILLCVVVASHFPA